MNKINSFLLEKIAPAQIRGKESITSQRITLSDLKTCNSLFDEVKARLLNVNQWRCYAGKGTATFQLMDGQGKAVFRPVQEGDYFQVDIPGPGPRKGNKKDWVKVYEINSEGSPLETIFFITVKVANTPFSMDNEVAHFFKEGASSTFFVLRTGWSITVGVLGRNEEPNVRTATKRDCLRNFIAAIAAMAGLSKMQWSALTKGLLRYQEKTA